MKNIGIKLVFLLFFLSPSTLLLAQSGGFSGNLVSILLAFAVLLLLFAVIMVANNLLQIEAKKIGADKDGTNYSLFPTGEEIFGSSKSANIGGFKTKVLKKGHDIKLEGVAEKTIAHAKATTFAIQPIDFVGISPIPKMLVEVGDNVKAGDKLFFDKKRPDVKYVSPVSGEVIAVNRGAKRSIKEVVILADKEMTYRSLELPNLDTTSRGELIDFMADSGCLSLIVERPFQVVPSLVHIPKAIFVTTFDSAPLAPDLNFVVEGQAAAFQKGLDVLRKLTNGKVHLGVNAKNTSSVFTGAKGVEINAFSGKHPVGNVGVQIHHTNPINANEKVWTVGVQEVITIGNVFLNGRYDASRIVAVTGAELANPQYVKTYQGAAVEGLLKDNLQNEEARIITGDVLSGQQIDAKGYLSFHDDQITVVEEGNEYEMFGWLLPSFKPTASKAFPSAMFSDLIFKANTNTNGEKRAFVATGQYEKVLPMDIYPQHLMKAIMTGDFERMEGLGIYELAEEDLAICEFACTSKQPLQQILRDGLDMMREQG